MQDCESQLLAAWISGHNQEHIKEFDDFTYHTEIVKAVKTLKEVNLATVSKETGIRINKLAEFTSCYMPSLYDHYYRLKKEEKVKMMIGRVAANPSDLEKQLKAIQDEMETLSVTKIKEPTNLTKAYLEEFKKRAKIEPLKYGLPTLDYITGGIRRQELTTIAARPGIGKTALAWQVAVNLAIKEHSVQFYPLEMAGFQLMERLVCRETEIKGEVLKAPKKMTEKDKEQLKDFFEIYGMSINKNINVVEGVRNLSEIKRHIEHYRPEIVVIDQLTQLKENKRFNSIREQFSYMTNTLKAMTMELDIPIILLAQINRDADGKEPTLRDLKESGSIEEDSDNVIMLHQTDEQDGLITPVTIIVRKQRNGAKDVRIDCAYQNEKYTFKEVL